MKDFAIRKEKQKTLLSSAKKAPVKGKAPLAPQAQPILTLQSSSSSSIIKIVSAKDKLREK